MERLLENIFIVEGILFAILGVIFIFNPANSILTLTALSGAFVIALGLISIIKKPRSITLGIVNIIFGLGLISMPLNSIDLIITFYGAWSIVRGIYLIVVTFKGNDINRNFSFFYAGIMIILGALVVLNPLATLISSSYILGAYFILTSICELYIGMKF